MTASLRIGFCTTSGARFPWYFRQQGALQVGINLLPGTWGLSIFLEWEWIR